MNASGSLLENEPRAGTSSKTSVASQLHRLTYKRLDDLEPGIDIQDLERFCPLENGWNSRAEATGCTAESFGTLRVIPPEIWDTLLMEMGIKSITCLRAINHSIRSIVDTHPKYRVLLNQAPALVRAVVSTRLSPSPTLSQLHKLLCSQSCSVCGEFGAWVHLLTANRVCYICFTTNPEFQPVLRPYIRAAYGLEKGTVIRLPTMLSLPGTYGLYFNGRSHQKRQILVDNGAALRAAIHLHGSRPALNIFMEQRRLAQGGQGSQHTEMMMAYVHRLSGLHRSKGRPHREGVPSIAEKDSYPRRFMCVVRIPWYDRKTGKLDFGRACRGCAQEQQYYRYGSQETTADCRRMYSEIDFIEHIAHCAESQRLLRTYMDNESLGIETESQDPYI